MKLVIMQPYFLPYLGYWQMMQEADIFVIYDNIQFTKKGWIHRNRMLQNGQEHLFSIALQKDSDYKNVCERKISEHFDKEKLLRVIESAYAKAPYFGTAFPVIEHCISAEHENLFDYIYHSVDAIKKYLNINTKLIKSSAVHVDHDLKSQDKVIAICEKLSVDTYINPIGGVDLYDQAIFKKHQIDLKFHKIKDIAYAQFNNEFVPHLSIMDVMMFNDVPKITDILSECDFR